MILQDNMQKDQEDSMPYVRIIFERDTDFDLFHANANRLY